jgi:hypothetical protein
MPKEKPILLSDNLRTLINYTGGDWGLVKSDLMRLLASAESLENGQSLREAESEVLSLEAQIKELNLENSELQSLLEQSNTEVNRLRLEQSDSSQDNDKEPPELDVEAVNILLQICEAPYSASSIARTLDLPRFLIQHHLNILHRLDFVECGPEESINGNIVTVWLAKERGIGYLSKLGAFGKAEPKKEHLSSAERRILRYIDQWGLIAADAIAQLLDTGVDVARSMLYDLSEADWVDGRFVQQGTTLYGLTSKGKAWVAQNPAEPF